MLRNNSSSRRPIHRGAAVLALLVLALTSACSTHASAGTGSSLTVTIGYQSKTINTVTAGTLLRSKHYFEDRLNAIGAKSGTTYKVVWKDYDTGAPITAQMLAGKIDIGSMGDFPVLINGSKTAPFDDARTEYVATTGYNLHGGLNSVVVPTTSHARALADLRGLKVSTSVGSAGHGLLIRALQQAGLPADAVQVENQGPAIGSSALLGGSVQALSQFVAWPGLLVFKGQAKVLYDGAAVNVPTFHGVVARKSFTTKHPEVTKAFLAAVDDATIYLHTQPLAAAESVASTTGLPPEVVYLYNGRNGISTFDTTIKAQEVAALNSDVPFLQSLGVLKKLDVSAFVNDSYLREVYGSAYEKDAQSTVNAAAITGQDPVCHTAATDPRTAGEVWLDGEESTRPAATPTCLLRQIKNAVAQGHTVRAAYVPDATTGTRWFAKADIWVDDPHAGKDARFEPFTTEAAAAAYAASHPGAAVVTYDFAVAHA